MNNYGALILPAFASSLGLYLMKQFMDSMVPGVILEAAKIDGANDFKIYSRIVMPIVKPAWLTLIVFSFQALWSANGGIYIKSEELKTLSYAIGQIVAGGIARAGAGAAAIVLMMLPPIIIFIVTQSNVIDTMATSGIKD
jgi:ABC-type glycerol-3-phosphate transport system permease component